MQLVERNVLIEFTEEAKSWCVHHGYVESMGARPIARIIQEKVKKPLADDILFGKLKEGGVVKVCVDSHRDVSLQSLQLEIVSASNFQAAHKASLKLRKKLLTHRKLSFTFDDESQELENQSDLYSSLNSSSQTPSL